MTIHRAQGLTLDSIAVDPRAFAHGQFYTALTRVRRASDICLTGPVTTENIIVDTLITEFDNKLLLRAC